MAKIRITQTNGAAAEDISAAIGQFLKQQDKLEQWLDAVDRFNEGDEHAFDGMTVYLDHDEEGNL